MLALELLLTFVGVRAVWSGRLAVGWGRAVVGRPARLLGCVALLPVPLAALAGVLVAVFENPDAPPSLAQVALLLAGIELGICASVAAVVYGVGARVAGRANNHLDK